MPRKITSFFLTFALGATALAAIPVRWTVDTFRVKPLVYDCYHGETLDLAAALTAYGEPIDLSGSTASLYWQTNGMGSVYWVTNATVASSASVTNILAAVFSGAYDPGAPTVYGFICASGDPATAGSGDPATAGSGDRPTAGGRNYRASFQLNFRPSPGFDPAALPLPTPSINCATTAFLNPEDAPFAVKGGSGGATLVQVTNVANYRISQKVAPWAMSGQPQPTTDLTGMTNFVRGVAQSGTNYTDAVAANYLPLTGGTLTGHLTVEDEITAGRIYSDSISGSFNGNVTVGGATTNYCISAMSDVEETQHKDAIAFYPEDETSCSWLIPDNSAIITANRLNNDFPIVTNAYTKAEVDAALGATNTALRAEIATKAPAVTGGYLPLSAGEDYNLTDSLYVNGAVVITYDNDGALCFVKDRYQIQVEDNGIANFYKLPYDYNGILQYHNIMTDLTADFHIVTTAPVTSGQIGNFNITNLTAKTISCNVSTTNGKASDILIWTWGNTAECQMTFTLPSGFTLVGDAADTKASANKKCLFSLVKISNTEVIVSKKEY